MIAEIDDGYGDEFGAEDHGGLTLKEAAAQIKAGASDGDLLPALLRSIDDLADEIGQLTGEALAFVHHYSTWPFRSVEEDLQRFRERRAEVCERIFTESLADKTSLQFLDRAEVILLLQAAATRAVSAVGMLLRASKPHQD